MKLVERDAALQRLADLLSAVASGTGHVALIAGEAGIGKTSLVKALAARRGNAALWWGSCDALETPHPLAPLHDIARSSGARFGPMLQFEGGRATLFGAVLTDLQQNRWPTLLVIEDAHWADDATLDLLRFLGRRIDRAACLLVISYRDDELASAHPLRRVLGDLPAGLVTRVALPRLTAPAVELLARSASRSPDGIYAATHGNPFFVTELLSHAVDTVPGSVQDLVLARFARLSPKARAIIQLASVVPAKIEPWLVGLLGGDVAEIEECLHSGLLTSIDGAVCFRHELARAAIETSLSEPVARALHADVLAALAREDRTRVSLARLVHHATRAGDVATVLSHAPGAAREAQQRGAHREAAAHYRTLLQHAGSAGDAERVAWLDAYARECHLTDQLSEAIAARLELDALQRRRDDVSGEAENLSQLGGTYVLALMNGQADAASRRAIELLESLPASVQLANAYRGEAQLRMLNRECEESVRWATRAIELAGRFGHREILAAATGTLGAAMMFSDYEAACAHLGRALELALADGLHHIAANLYSNLGTGSGELFRLREAEPFLVQAIAFASRHEIDFYRNYAIAWLALCEMYLGRWDDAGEHARDVVEQTTHRGTSRVMALVALGRLRARRGDPGVAETLDEALELALASGTLQRIAPVRAARAEAAWLRADKSAVAAEAAPALALAAKHRHPWFTGELALWMQRAGFADATTAPCAPPYALQISGRWREAATAWAELGCPYEQARALEDGDLEARLEALAIFEQLGARPAAETLRRGLRASGLRGLPRGMRASTQTNPHQLTAREVEVLLLLCEGMKNSEIAERLCRSVRTVDHHLAAVFAKLGVASRIEAVSAAQRIGLHPQYGQGKSAM